jgi:hypothetical protein
LRWDRHSIRSRHDPSRSGSSIQEDVVDIMPLTRSPATPATRRLRPSGPHCRGGASSMLRLANPASPRLPKAPDLSGWVMRAAGMLGIGAEARPAFAASEFSR